MASKRKFKRIITLACSELFIDAVANENKIKDKNPTGVLPLLEEILSLETEYLARINRCEKFHAKEHFRKISEDFVCARQALVSKILG